MVLLISCSSTPPEKKQVIIPTTLPKSEFAPGIYFRKPFRDIHGGVLKKLDSSISSSIDVEAFDIRPTAIVYAIDDKLVLVAPDGKANPINIPGLHQIDRPSFSPDGKKVAVQARETYTEPEDINIYIVDLKTKKFERISHLHINEESPEWFKNQNKVVYTSFGPRGLVAHIYDLDAGKEVQTIPKAGSIHLAVSPDGTLLFNPVLSRLYNIKTGEMVADLKKNVLTALKNHGHNLDTRFQGQAAQGTFPMDADFSPDGKHIIFDGAVEKNGQFGLMIFRMTTSGNNITPITGVIEVNPAYSNGNNYSQLNPNWFGKQIKEKTFLF
jgi:Tol biopolymer transport system component